MSHARELEFCNRKLKELDGDMFAKYSELSPRRERWQALWRMEWDFEGVRRMSTALVGSGETHWEMLEHAFNWAQDPPAKRRAIFREALLEDIEPKSQDSGRLPGYGKICNDERIEGALSAIENMYTPEAVAALRPGMCLVPIQPGDVWANRLTEPQETATVKDVSNGMVGYVYPSGRALVLSWLPRDKFLETYPHHIGDIRLPENFKPTTKDQTGTPSDDMRAEFRKEFGSGFDG